MNFPAVPDRNADELIERHLIDIARAADAVRLARATTRRRRELRAMRRLHRTVDRAAADGVLLGEKSARDRLAVHLEGRFSAHSLPDYVPRTSWAATTRLETPTKKEAR
ncbi:hypothetical protein [Nocardia fluminea]|uniref:hypothetical protein n=1 Tax=Nocardia fluminea TaxID=134984 RepID=UPI0037B819CD